MNITHSFSDQGETFLSCMTGFGLHITGKTGGAYYCGLENATLHTTLTHESELTLEDGASIPFFSPALFLKTVELTEESLGVSLSTNT